MSRTPSMSSTGRSRAGYTVVELLIVSSVLSVLTLMSAGVVADYMTERHVAAASEIVKNDLQQAFAVAARNRRPVRVSFSAPDTALLIADRASSAPYVRRGLGNGSGLMLRPSDLTFCASTCSDAFVDVFPNGWASDTLSITIGSPSYARTVTMSRSGLVSVRNRS